LRLKKGSFVTAVIVFCLVILAACNKDESVSSEGETENEEEVKLNIVDGKIDPPVTISTVMPEDPRLKFREGETYSDNAHTRWAADNLGVEFEFLWTAPSSDQSYTERLNLSLAAGDEQPDILMARDENMINTLMNSGYYMEVGEVFDKYASDVWKEAMSEHEPSVWHQFTREDGGKYGIPVLSNVQGDQAAMWYRQDWLDKLGLDAPTNLEELEAVLEAFSSKDPDGNGKDDTTPIMLTGEPNFTGSPLGSASPIFGMFGAMPEIWYPNEDGELEYGSVQPEIKDALRTMREWKENGYIAEEFALTNYFAIGEEIATGKVGITTGPDWFGHNHGRGAEKADPDAVYKAHLTPEGPDGDVMRIAPNPFIGGIFINKDISEEKLQAWFHYYNTLWSMFDSEDPLKFREFQEGVDYVVKEDGTLSKDVPGGDQNSFKMFVPGGAALKFESRQTLPEDKKERPKAFGRAVLVEQKEADVREHFVGPATSTMKQRWEMLNRMEVETYLDIIYGDKPVDAFDDFVEEWYASGGEEVTKEVNEWYKSVQK
jgi:putative aldouronate transport system substrate-binding protein